jgi:hypothetical protein
MHEIIGNFWEEAKKDCYDAIICTTNEIIKTNGELVMGAGIAKDFAQRYPNSPLEWGQRIKEIGEDYHVLVSLLHSKPHLVALQTKKHWRDNSSYYLVKSSLYRLQLIAVALNWKKVLMTRPGCGNGGLDWNEIKKQFINNNYDRFYVINKT